MRKKVERRDDMFERNEFMDFMCYRDMMVEDKIKECLDGKEDPETMDRKDFINEEVEYIKREVQKRSGK